MTSAHPLTASVRARVPLTAVRAGKPPPGAVPGRGGGPELVSFRRLRDGRDHTAYVVPPLGDEPLVRIHSECFTGDVLGSTRCDCGSQLDEALRRLLDEGGVLLYLRQEGRGIGLYNKLDAYLLQDRDVDTYEANRMLGRGADERDYEVAAQMLLALGLPRVRLLTNNPDKVGQLVTHGITVTAVEPTAVHLTPDSARYLRAKREIGGHTFTSTGSTASSFSLPAPSPRKRR
ncbi:GTP cyclohydrolase II [Streptomyces netropsis]